MVKAGSRRSFPPRHDLGDGASVSSIEGRQGKGDLYQLHLGNSLGAPDSRLEGVENEVENWREDQ